jgi:hypothetical protein
MIIIEARGFIGKKEYFTEKRKEKEKRGTNSGSNKPGEKKEESTTCYV